MLIISRIKDLLDDQKTRVTITLHWDIYSVYLCEISANEVDITTKCYRTMRKNEQPHKINITVRKDEKVISDSRCSCVAGYVNCLMGYTFK